MGLLKDSLKFQRQPVAGELVRAAAALSRTLKYVPVDINKRQSDELEHIRSLLKCGAKVDETDSLNYTPLCWAAQMGRTDVVQILVNAGADIDHAIDNRLNPISVAQVNFPQVAQLLQELNEPRRLLAEEKERARIKYICEPQLHRDMPVPKVLRLPPRAGMK
jgi:ankyrin repeat protein